MTQPTRFRPELQGLRALAAALVVIYHVWLGRISGGVDVFFLVTGFLITGQLFRATQRGGIKFQPMWGRMIKRLFPATMTVLLATVVLGYLLLPEGRWFQTIREVVAAALFVENWQLAADSADYFAQHDQASVVQHFWSLSIQGQFYLVWPLFIAFIVFLGRRIGWELRRSLVVALTVVSAASLAYSVWLTAVDQPFAYFTSLTRVWEFAFGGLLALAIDALVLPRAVRVVLGWLGVVGLVSCGLVLQVGTVFPGYAALWPIISAALVLVAGSTGSKIGADRLLGSRPLEYLGNISFSLYLWHWPVLLFYLIARDQEEVGLRGGAVVIAASVVLAVLTYHLVENPVRYSKVEVKHRWGAYRFGAIALVPVLVAAGGWQFASQQKSAFAFMPEDPAYPGAKSMLPGAATVPETGKLMPPFAALQDQFAFFEEHECQDSDKHAELLVCATQTMGEPERRIVVAGDSHSQQYNAALRPIAKERNWQIISMGRGGCPFSSDGESAPEDAECASWNAAVADEIIEMQPDAVFTIGTRDVRVGLTEWTPPGYVEQWRRVADAGVPVVAVRDNPRYDDGPSDCVETNGAQAPECSTPRAELLAPEAPYAELTDLPPNVHFLDFSDYFCTVEVCPPVIGNVLVYLDNNHVTAAYMETMSSILDEQLIDTLNWQ
ncbi:acyltransferase family protein [Prauserella cavernicola]|uniref:Acyltransferase n=1 Tax=Prauserella cavernicola TaxID=2800127 RepID=A0A934QMF1_9PSEU|nr:acyltransferase family protein [Prauserella cavernicola]MBK1782745.1 acyltransferase [Prauserella cavernicola]